MKLEDVKRLILHKEYDKALQILKKYVVKNNEALKLLIDLYRKRYFEEHDNNLLIEMKNILEMAYKKGNKNALNYLINILFTLHDLESAKKYINKLREPEKTQANIQYLIERGLIKEARNKLKEKIEETHDPVYYILLFRLFFNLGDFDKAFEVVKEGLDYNSENKELKRLYTVLDHLKNTKDKEIIGIKFDKDFSYELYSRRIYKNVNEFIKNIGVQITDTGDIFLFLPHDAFLRELLRDEVFYLLPTTIPKLISDRMINVFDKY